MARVYVSVGSNVERERNVRSGVAELEEAFGPLTLSRVYETEPVGCDGGAFYNLVVGFETHEPPDAVVRALKAIEGRHGRSKAVRGGPRTLDLDLLLYDDHVIETPGMVLPRPEIERHPFVLGPLAEIAGERRHPVTGERFAQMWSRLAAPAALRPAGLDPLGDAGGR